jgi:hypothetical protein
LLANGVEKNLAKALASSRRFRAHLQGKETPRDSAGSRMDVIR